MRPEWLVDIPNDLARAWCVLPRPEGRRELVVASRGRTAARAKTGGVSRRFASALPGGSRRTKHGKAEGDFCILDCVFHEPDATYYVLDTLAWNGVSLYDCAAEMRAAWTHAKLGHPETAECPEAGRERTRIRGERVSVLAAARVRRGRGGDTGTRTTRCRCRSSGTVFCSSPRTARTSSASRPWRRCGKTRGARGHFLEENPGAADPERQTGGVVAGRDDRRRRDRRRRAGRARAAPARVRRAGGRRRRATGRRLAGRRARQVRGGRRRRGVRRGRRRARRGSRVRGFGEPKKGARRGRGDQDSVPVQRATQPDHGRRAVRRCRGADAR